MQERVGIVVLNYLSFKDTIECVESIIRNVSYANYFIVVIDNGSDNESLGVLKDRFKDSSKVIILSTVKNLGFAKGNNYGIKEARRMAANFVLCINSDTIVQDKDFLLTLIDDYQSSGAAIIGPRITSSRDGREQNPIRITDTKIRTVIRLIFVYLGGYAWTYLPTSFATLKGKVINIIGPRRIDNRIERKDHELKDGFILHGSCILFTPTFFRYYEGFYSKTFLYGEELFLHEMLRKRGLKSSYVEKTCIYHREKVSTECFTGPEASSKWKKRFRLKYGINSLLRLLYFKLFY